MIVKRRGLQADPGGIFHPTPSHFPVDKLQILDPPLAPEKYNASLKKFYTDIECNRRRYFAAILRAYCIKKRKRNIRARHQ